MEKAKITKSTQEQATGVWIDYLNQARINILLETLSKQDSNLSEALGHLDWAVTTIGENIIERNRGGEKGMHGFIAEISECGIGNARESISGQAASHVWIDDNGPSDILRGTTEIQQKFVQSGGHLSLKAVEQHLERYPNYISNGGKYQIPKDHYDKVKEYLSMPESVANKLPSNGEFTLRQWKEVHNFFDTSGVSVEDLEPSYLSYDEVQKDSISERLEQEKEHIHEQDEETRRLAYEDSKPSFSEATKATVVGAALEGTTEFCLAIIRKRKTGKKVKDFTHEDWAELGMQAGKGALRGSVRGATVYALTNFTSTPGAVASAMVTAGFSVAQQVYKFRKGMLSEQQLIENAEIVCLEASVSALSSLIGQAAIPVPVLGAIIGNAVGMMLYNFAKDSFAAREKAIINRYIDDLRKLDESLKAEYEEHLEMLNRSFLRFLDILTRAFSVDIKAAFEGSIILATQMGVPTDEILYSHDDIVAYFMA